MTQFGKFSRHKFLLLLMIILCLFLVVSIILASLGILGRNSELVSIKVTKDRTAFVPMGYGINLDSIPVSNLLKEPSFEQQEYSYALTVADCRENEVFFNCENDVLPTELFERENINLVGSRLRIMNSGNNGDSFVQSYVGKITDYSVAEFGVMHDVQISDDNMYASEQIVKLISTDNAVTALTDGGHIISDLLSDITSYQEFENEFFVDMCSMPTGIAAITKHGDIFFSTDGRNFSRISDEDIILNFYDKLDTMAEVPNVSGMVCSERIINVIMSNGDIIIYRGGTSELLEKPYGKIVFFAEDNECSVLVNDKGEVYKSQNGIVYAKLENVSKMITETFEAVSNISAVEMNGDVLYIAGFDGKILCADCTDESVTVSDVLLYDNIDVKKYAFRGEHQVLACDFQGRTYLVNTLENKYQSLNSDSCFVDDFFCLPDGKVLIVSGNNTFETSVFMGISVDSVIGEDTVLSGDLCYIDITDSPLDLSFTDSSWEVYGDNVFLSSDPSAAVGYGNTSAVLTGTGDGVNIMSQKIGVDPVKYIAKDGFYRMNLNLKQEGLSDVPVQAWISVTKYDEIASKEVTLFQEGFTIDKVGAKYKNYDYIFAVTTDFSESRFEGATLRFNIAFEGSGSLHIDGAYLGLDKYSEASIINPISDMLAEGAPSIIRLNNLGIGCSGFSEDAFYSMTCNSGTTVNNVGMPSCESLEDSLRLVYSSNAVPWLVIGSMTDSEMVDNLIEYYCSSIETEYGRMRIDNGTAVPWSRQFDTVIIEINDENRIFESDIQRSGYVNFIMTTIQQSEFYNDIKDSVVFVDGMNYDGGVVLSSADFHCNELYVDSYSFMQNPEKDTTTEMTVETQEQALGFVEKCDSFYQDYNYSVPRHNRTGVNVGGELISSLDVSGFSNGKDISAAEILSFVMCNQAESYNAIMLDLDLLRYAPTTLEDTDDTNILKTERNIIEVIGNLSFAHKAEEMTTIYIDPFDKSNINAEEFVKKTYARAVCSDDKLYVIVFNTSDELISFNLKSDDFVFEKNKYYRYSSESKLLYTRDIGNQNEYYNLQPGEYMICEINTEV
ncbi:MAG: hypothetical protein MJ153_05575 [Clostridia bacterium]|nr:hypothetical protein [Clostridia bacterium]